MLLKGGTSGERDISLKSGAACAEGLRSEGFTVEEIDPADADAFHRLVDYAPDVVFIALHGGDGEDGSIQGLLQSLGIPFTGPGVLASALAMDKSRAKSFYLGCGLPTAPWVTLAHGSKYDSAEVLEKVGCPCVVKPASEGSALGVHIVNSPDEFEPAVQEALTHAGDIVVERFLDGIEVTCAVLGNDDPEALPVIEIVPQGESEFYDFEAKYAIGGADHIIPARISDELTRKCQQIAVETHKALGCRGVSRSDIIIEGDNCWLLETNTIPGMTETSLLPDAAAKVGIEFGPLCRMLLELALEDAE